MKVYLEIALLAASTAGISAKLGGPKMNREKGVGLKDNHRSLEFYDTQGNDCAWYGTNGCAENANMYASFGGSAWDWCAECGATVTTPPVVEECPAFVNGADPECAEDCECTTTSDLEVTFHNENGGSCLSCISPSVGDIKCPVTKCMKFDQCSCDGNHDRVEDANHPGCYSCEPKPQICPNLHDSECSQTSCTCENSEKVDPFMDDCFSCYDGTPLLRECPVYESADLNGGSGVQCFPESEYAECGCTGNQHKVEMTDNCYICTDAHHSTPDYDECELSDGLYYDTNSPSCLQGSACTVIRGDIFQEGTCNIELSNLETACVPLALDSDGKLVPKAGKEKPCLSSQYCEGDDSVCCYMDNKSMKGECKSMHECNYVGDFANVWHNGITITGVSASFIRGEGFLLFGPAGTDWGGC